MIAILLYSLLFIFGLICTISSIPETKKKFLGIWFPDHTTKNPTQDSTKPIKSSAVSSQDEKGVTEKSSITKSDSLKSVFATFDKNRDGFITKQELKDSLKNIGIYAGEKDVADMVQKVDANGDGLIDFDEFCELFGSISGNLKPETEAASERDGELKEAFDVFDENRDGLITVEELGLVLSSLGFVEGNKLEACKEMINKVDIDGDGMVNFDEFKTMMRSGDLGKLISVS